MKLELRDITKRFGSFTANDSISLTVEPGQIHALLGENGAGKSTLMNTIYGMHAPTSGQMLLDDEPVSFSGPGDAVAAGIGMVHQHFMLIPVFSVTESVALGYEPTSGAGMIDFAAARKRVEEISARFGFDVDPDTTIEELPVGAQQRRDHQSLGAGRQSPDPGRAHRGPHTPGDGRADQHHASAQGGRHLHPLHHAQAA